MLKVEALRAELDQTRLRGAPLHHGYGAQHLSPTPPVPGHCHRTRLPVRPHGAPDLVAGERAEYRVAPGV